MYRAKPLLRLGIPWSCVKETARGGASPPPPQKRRERSIQQGSPPPIPQRPLPPHTPHCTLTMHLQPASAICVNEPLGERPRRWTAEWKVGVSVCVVPETAGRGVAGCGSKPPGRVCVSVRSSKTVEDVQSCANVLGHHSICCFSKARKYRKYVQNIKKHKIFRTKWLLMAKVSI